MADEQADAAASGVPGDDFSGLEGGPDVEALTTEVRGTIKNLNAQAAAALAMADEKIAQAAAVIPVAGQPYEDRLSGALANVAAQADAAIARQNAAQTNLDDAQTAIDAIVPDTLPDIDTTPLDPSTLPDITPLDLVVPSGDPALADCTAEDVTSQLQKGLDQVKVLRDDLLAKTEQIKACLDEAKAVRDDLVDKLDKVKAALNALHQYANNVQPLLGTNDDTEAMKAQLQQELLNLFP